MTSASFTCTCGTVKGTLANATPSGGNHCVCFCASCRAGAIHSGDPDPAPDGVKLFQIVADQARIDTGMDRLSIFRFGPKSLMRIKADCCDCQLFSLQPNAKLPIAALVSARLSDPSVIGPVVSRAFVPKDNGKAGHKNIPAFLKVGMRALGARITGRWKGSPFYDASSLEPTLPVEVLPKGTRKALLGPSSS